MLYFAQIKKLVFPISSPKSAREVFFPLVGWQTYTMYYSFCQYQKSCPVDSYSYIYRIFAFLWRCDSTPSHAVAGRGSCLLIDVGLAGQPRTKCTPGIRAPGKALARRARRIASSHPTLIRRLISRARSSVVSSLICFLLIPRSIPIAGVKTAFWMAES